MEVVGLCDICGKPSKHLYTCKKCGRKVCSKHYMSGGLCTLCTRRKKSSMPVVGPDSELVVPESAKPTKVEPGQIKK